MLDVTWSNSTYTSSTSFIGAYKKAFSISNTLICRLSLDEIDSNIITWVVENDLFSYYVIFPCPFILPKSLLTSHLSSNINVDLLAFSFVELWSFSYPGFLVALSYILFICVISLILAFSAFVEYFLYACLRVMANTYVCFWVCTPNIIYMPSTLYFVHISSNSNFTAPPNSFNINGTQRSWCKCYTSTGVTTSWLFIYYIAIITWRRKYPSSRLHAFSFWIYYRDVLAQVRYQSILLGQNQLHHWVTIVHPFLYLH